MSQLVKQGFIRVLIIACVSFLSIQAVIAGQSRDQVIPEDLLALDHQRCMNGCVPGFGSKTCKPLCDCTVGEFKKRLNFEAYLDMSVQISKNEISPSIRALLDDVAKMCTAEIERMGIEVGTGDALPPSR